jgi:TPR repeat protein
LRRGDANAAAQMLAPLAAAGAARAQALLGRAQEARPSAQRSDFEAYVWYGIAARNGQAGAQSQRERVGAKLQPAEIRQADQIIERWKPRAEPVPSHTNDRTAP